MNQAVKYLLVEDNDDHAAILFRCFPEEASQNAIFHVRNGIEALAYLRNEAPYVDGDRPDLILLDLKMPLMDGHETLSAIKNDPALKDIPVIVLSTSDAESDIRKACDLHANSYVTKPFETKQIREMADAVRKFWCNWHRRPRAAP